VATVLLVLAIFLAYSGSLRAPFVYDDTLAIPENPTIRKLWPLTSVLLPQAEGGLTVSGRPILNLSFAINHAISGHDVWSYHVFNILVHTLSGLLVFGIARRTLMRLPAHASAANTPAVPQRDSATLIAFAIAALWALHPLLTQAVTYTVQRAESMMGCFYLLTLYAFIRGVGEDPADAFSASTTRRRWFGASLVACMGGMGTKEVMATAPLIVLLYDRTFIAGTFGEAWRRRSSYYLMLAATWLVLAPLVISTGGNRGGTVGLGTGVSWWAYPLTQFEALTRYLGLALWPQPLVFEYGTFWVKRAAEVLPYALLILPLLVLTILALRRNAVLGFMGAWFFLILAPTSLAPGTIQMIVEHRIYLPLVAMVAGLVVMAHRWVGRPGVAGAIVLAVGAGVLTYSRNEDYRSALALWGDTVSKRPLNPRAHDGLAEAYEALGRRAEALVHRREAVRLQPDESTYHYNLAMTLNASGLRDEALQHYRESLRLTPNEARTHNNLAILLGEMGNEAAARFHYGEAMRLRPKDPLYHYNQGVAQMRAGHFAAAAESFTAALRNRPDYADAHFNLGTALMRQNQVTPALAHYTEALRLKPTDVEYRTTFGGALLIASRPADALEEFNRALRTSPEAIEARFGVANALAALRRTEEAKATYEDLLRRAPRHAAARFKLGNVLLDLDRVAEAITHYKMALEISPVDAEAHHNLGVAYARLEQWAEARGAFETALRLKPDYTDARRNLEQLKALLGR
jgi:tetratricopeptide (TPR) repeat protein